MTSRAAEPPSPTLFNRQRVPTAGPHHATCRVHSQFLRKVRRSLAHRGLWGTRAYVPAFAAYRVQRLHPARKRAETHALQVQQQFDHDFSVDTADITPLGHWG